MESWLMSPETRALVCRHKRRLPRTRIMGIDPAGSPAILHRPR
jgi:hypothetical protein